jgi:hypothetical protein
MKLLVITAIKEFKKDILQMLRKAEVKNFSFREVTGYRDSSQDAVASNWFASEMNESESILFYAFVNKENVDMFFNLVAVFNAEQHNASRVHVAVLNIEKSNDSAV